MPRSLLIASLIGAAVFSTGCPATTATATPPADLRAAHLAQVPAAAEFVGQADLSRVLDGAVLERWLRWLLPLQERPVDPACALALLGRTRQITEAVLPGTGPDEEVMLLLSGELTAAEVAACAASLMGREVPAPNAEGVYEFAVDHEAMLVADLAIGGVGIGTPAGLAQARGPAPAGDASLAASSSYQRLRSLLGAGPFDLDAYSTMPLRGDGFGADGIGVTLRRGTPDRYEVAVLAGNADSANAIAMFVATLPLLIAGIEAEMQAAAGEQDTDPALPAEAMTEALGVVAAVREALTAARTTVEGDVVRVVLEVDPARACPAQVLLVGGMLLFVSRGGEAAPPPPAPIPPETGYDVPGVPGSDVTPGQPPVE